MIITSTPLSGGLTNTVELLTYPDGHQTVRKSGENLGRDEELCRYAKNLGLKIVPQLIESNKEKTIIVMEYKSGVNGKDCVDHFDDADWNQLGTSLGSTLKNLHTIEQLSYDRDLCIQQMIDYLSRKDPCYTDPAMYQSRLDRLQKILTDTNERFVWLHGDYSPHNCLFEQGDNGRSISALLDPSGRLSYGHPYMDLSYASRTRRIRQNSCYVSSFLDAYGYQFDTIIHDPVFVVVDACMRQYLAELYASMGDENSAIALV